MPSNSAFAIQLRFFLTCVANLLEQNIGFCAGRSGQRDTLI
jgi:hypothetical protein